MAVYQTKPVAPEVVEARQFTDESIADELAAWGDEAHIYRGNQHGHTSPPWQEHTCMLFITRDGDATATVGDWIVKYADGAFDVFSPTDFAAKFEVAGPTPSAAGEE